MYFFKSHVFEVGYRPYTPIPHRPQIDFFIRGDSLSFSPIVIIYESVQIQIRCRYEYSEEFGKKNLAKIGKNDQLSIKIGRN